MNRVLKQGIIAATAAAVACGDATGVIQKPRTVQRSITHGGKTHAVILKPNGDLEHRINGRLFAKQHGTELTIYSGKQPTVLKVRSLPRAGQKKVDVSALFVPGALYAQHAACAKELAFLAAASAVFVGAAEAFALLPSPPTALALGAATAGYVGATLAYAMCEQTEYDKEIPTTIKVPEA